MSLGLKSLARCPRSRLSAARVAPAEAMQCLLSAASHGGAYGHGEGSAWGRLQAWRSLAALAGADESGGAEAAECCTWVMFVDFGPWFYDVAWDLGLVALRPDRRSLAVLAATYTD